MYMYQFIVLCITAISFNIIIQHDKSFTCISVKLRTFTEPSGQLLHGYSLLIVQLITVYFQLFNV